MVWVHLDFPLRITLEGPLHIGTGYDRGLIQRTIVRDIQGNVYIPGSSLKGKTRNSCEDLARSCDLVVCGLPRVGEAPELANHKPEQCLVCRVFGCPGGNIADGRALSWQDAHRAEGWSPVTRLHDTSHPWPIGQTTTRTQVQLSRARGTAAEDRLYTSEFAAHGLEFTGRISGWLNATPCTVSGDAGYHEVNLLLAGLRLVEMLGGSRSRGAGRCQIQVPSQIAIRRVGEEKTENHKLADLMAATEWLGLFSEEGGDGHRGA